MSRYDIMHEHVDARICGRLYPAHSLNVRRTDTWLSLRDLIIVWRWFRYTIKRSQCSGNEEDSDEQSKKIEYLPAEKYPYLLLRFYDTYIYLLLYLESISFL
jgi:hypothetical protein